MAFPKTPEKIIAVTIDENGDVVMLKIDAADVFLEQGVRVTSRASHVEPYFFWDRVLFHILRTLFADDSRVAAWTRTWQCWWRVNTAPVGGPILTWADVWDPVGAMPIPHVGHRTAAWKDRQRAIAAEVTFLNKYFLERGIR